MRLFAYFQLVFWSASLLEQSVIGVTALYAQAFQMASAYIQLYYLLNNHILMSLCLSLFICKSGDNTDPYLVAPKIFNHSAYYITINQYLLTHY